MNREEKAQVIEELVERFNNNNFFSPDVTLSFQTSVRSMESCFFFLVLRLVLDLPITTKNLVDLEI